MSDWVSSHVRAFEYFGGVTRAVVPDQLKSGVTKACRYEPGVQRTYEELAEHYGTTILPARPAHARDKAKVEVGVLIAQRWVLARLRNQTFFSLAELNEWGKTIGPNTASLCEAILNERRHPEQGYRSCLGILRLSKRYGHERLEAACKRALGVGARSYRHVESILSHGLDRVEPNEPSQQKEPRMHENVRCRQGNRAVYRRASRLFHELKVARADGSYQRLLARFGCAALDPPCARLQMARSGAAGWACGLPVISVKVGPSGTGGDTLHLRSDR